MQKRNYIQSSNFVNFHADKLWKLISSGLKVETWHPLVNSSVIKGDKRICKTDKGDLITSVLVNDSITMTYKYLIEPQKVYPHEGYIWSTFKVVKIDKGSILLWDIEFTETSKEKYKEIQESFATLSNMAKNNIEALSI